MDQGQGIADLQGSAQHIEDAYCTQSDRAHRKKFGQVFTPPRLAALMADWVGAIKPKTVIDPAFGTGALARAVWDRSPKTQIIGYDIDPVVCDYVADLSYENMTLKCEDYLAHQLDNIAGFIANPPYIRQRDLEGGEAMRRNLSARAGHAIPKSANIYIHFCTKMILELAQGGRAAIIIPSEWLNANFSTSLKAMLIERDCLKHIISFSHDTALFDDAMTTASILLLERPHD